MQKLIILDFSTGKVHIYSEELNVIIDEDYINTLGFKDSECAWMCSTNLQMYYH